MKKGLLSFLLAFILVLAGGAAYLRFAPTGALNPDSPDKAILALTMNKDFDYWAEAAGKAPLPSVTEFESAQAVTDAAIEALRGGAPGYIRAEGFDAAALRYTVLSDGHPVCTVSLVKGGGGWELGETVSGPELVSGTAVIGVPSGAELAVNGVTVGGSYITDKAAPYASLSELEAGFDTQPVMTVYTIPGLYLSPVVSASRDGRVLTEFDGGHDLDFTDSVTATVYVPSGAVLDIDGVTVKTEPSEQPFAELNVPEGAAAAGFESYTFEGLRDYPAVMSAALNGEDLPQITEGAGEIFYSAATVPEGAEEAITRFMDVFTAYASGHGFMSDLAALCVSGTQYYEYVRQSPPGICWVRGESVTDKEYTLGDIIALGGDAFVCDVGMTCAVTTYYETRDISTLCRMLFVKSGETWLCGDACNLPQ